MLSKPTPADTVSWRAPTYFRPWRELSALTLLLMELSAIVFIYRTLSTIGRETSAAYTYLIFGIVLLATYALTRTLYFLRMNLPTRRAATLILLLASWLIAMKFILYRGDPLGFYTIIHRNVAAFGDRANLLPPEFGILLVVLLLVLRGVVIAQRWMGAVVVVRSFRVGALLFLVLGLLRVISWKAVPGVEFNIFLLAGLVAMSAAKASELGALRGGIVNPFDRNWLASIGVGAGLVVTLVLVLAAISSLYLASPVARVATIAIEAILFLILLLLSPLLFLIMFVFAQSQQGVFSDVFVRLERELSLKVIGEVLGEIFQFLFGFVSGLVDWILSLMPEALDLRPLKPYLLAIVIVVAVLFLLGLLRRQGRVGMRWGRSNEERQSILDWDAFSKKLLGMFRRSAKQAGRGIRSMRHGGRLLAAARVRRIYAQLMRMCEQLDFPRMEAQTPLEFLATMKRRFPDHTRELAQITQAYLRVRYGELPETRAQVAQVEAAWRVVRKQGEAMRKSRRVTSRAAPRSLFKR